MNEQVNSTKDSGLGSILVTGGAGFVGQMVARTLLERGYNVRVLDVVPCPLSHPNLDARQGDICDTTFVNSICEGVDTIFHVAAIIELESSAFVTKKVRDLSYAVNIQGTQNLIDAAHAQGASRVV
jgi:3beta-hydroxy-delta5-steroid dehydrogenase/steroid delta-isomerase